MAAPYAGAKVQAVAGIEARGFILGGAIADRLGCGFVPLRKKGKLPWKTIGQEYTLEYGVDIIEMHEDAIDQGERILIVDDLIATGGTAEAAVKLVQRSGGEIVGATFIIDLPELGGMKKLAGARHREPCADGVRGALSAHGADAEQLREASAASPPGGPIRGAGRLSRLRQGGACDHRPLGTAACGVVCARPARLRPERDAPHPARPRSRRWIERVNIDGKPYRTIWLAADGWSVEIIDQTRLPHALVIVTLRDARGCGARDQDHAGARRAADRRHGRLRRLPGAARRMPPTRRSTRAIAHPRRAAAHRHQPALGAGRDARRRAQPAARRRASLPPTRARPRSAEADVATNRAIGGHGAKLIAADRRSARSRASASTSSPTATPAGSPASTSAPPRRRSTRRTTPASPLHVWVDETRPRNQGAALTAYELGAHGVPHTIIVDNAGGHLMQQGLVDLCIVGTDRVTSQRRRRQQDRHLPEGAGGQGQRRAVLRRLPHSTIDWTLADGARHPDRGAQRRRGADHERAHQGRHRWWRSRSPRPAAPPATTPST